MTTIKVQNDGKVTVRGDKLDLVTVHKGKVVFNVTDTSKFMYENGYTKQVKRVLTKKKTIRYGGVTLDLSEVNGMDKVEV